MPTTIAHAYFAKDVFEILPKSISDRFSITRYKMFAQGVDSFMFYNLFSIMPGKKVRKFQGYFHSHNSRDFFMQVLHYMKDNHIEDNDTYAFLAGFICHYALDSIVHPYIFYKTGYMRKGDASTYKYNGCHDFMEAFIDNDTIIRREMVNPYTFDFTSYCFDLYPFSMDLNKTIQYSFYNAFKFKDADKIYYKSLKQMRVALRLFRKDTWGVKKQFYKFIDLFTPRSFFKLEAVSYHQSLRDDNNYLNLDHTLWRNPTTYDMTSTESYVDLYIKAIKQAKVLICASFDYLDGKDMDLELIFTNLSYVTGLDCSFQRELKYFEY